MRQSRDDNTFYKSFRFYLDIDKPLGISTKSLTDFLDKIKSIDLKSIEFHTKRGDFELWIYHIGNLELALKIKKIRESKISGDLLRKKLYEAIKSHEIIKKEINLSSQISQYLITLGKHINIINKRLKNIESKIDKISNELFNIENSAIIIPDIELLNIIHKK
jgi:hypothetical protein